MRVLISILMLIFLAGCSKDNGVSTDNKNGRYQYPDYLDGYITISHSWYKACENPDFDTSSKEFFAGDTVFASISEYLGPEWQAPELGLDETAEITCSNGDSERFIFNYPYPQCVIHIDGILLRFSGIKTKYSSSIIANNNSIEVNKDSILIIARYRSYWTGNFVTDTAYIYH